MIARIWHGRTRAEEADAYLAFLRERAIPDYQSTPSNRGVFLLRRIDNDEAHFLTLTHWESLEAIRAFGGDEIARAKYYPEDDRFLLEFEPTVQHYELETAPGNETQRWRASGGSRIRGSRGALTEARAWSTCSRHSLLGRRRTSGCTGRGAAGCSSFVQSLRRAGEPWR